MPPKDAKQQKDKAAFANQEALQGLAARESQHRQLAAIRLELERLRLLLERVSKRERLKRESEQHTYVQAAVHQLPMFYSGSLGYLLCPQLPLLRAFADMFVHGSDTLPQPHELLCPDRWLSSAIRQMQ